MADPSIKATPSQILITMAAFVVVVAGMKAASGIIVPFLLAVFIAVISAPALAGLQRRGLPRWLALVVVLAAIIGIGTVLTGLVGNSLKEFTGNLPDYTARINGYKHAIESWIAGRDLPIGTGDLSGVVDASKAMQITADVFNSFRNVLTNAFLILLTVVFILFETASFPDKLRAIVDDPEHSLARFDKVIENVKRYLAIKTLASLATGLIVGLWLWAIGVQNVVLWAVLAFMLNYVPNIGSIIAAVPAVLLALVQLGVGGAVATAAGFLVANVVIGSLIEPRFMGRGLGLSTLVVFLSLIFWGWVLGLVGMFLSVPLTMTVKIVLDGRESTRWISTLLGPAGAVAKEPMTVPAAELADDGER